MQATGNNLPQSTYRLSIHVLVGGFSVSVYDLALGQVWQQQRAWSTPGPQGRADALRAVLADAHVSGKHYTRVEVVSHAPSTYVPVELFRRSDMASIYRLTFCNVRAGNADIRHRILPGMDVVEVLSLPHPIAQAVTALYPQVEMMGRAGQVVEQAANRTRTLPNAEARMHVQVDGGEMHLCLMSGAQLRFACAYQASTDADRLYYLMAAWRTLGLDAMDTPCLLSGEADSLKDELLNYIMNVETCA